VPDITRIADELNRQGAKDAKDAKDSKGSQPRAKEKKQTLLKAFFLLAPQGDGEAAC
jgi:hypothetical protein